MLFVFSGLLSELKSTFACGCIDLGLNPVLLSLCTSCEVTYIT